MSDSSKYPDSLVTDLLQEKDDQLLAYFVDAITKDQDAFSLLKKLLAMDREKTLVLLDNLFSNKNLPAKFYLVNYEFSSAAQNSVVVAGAKDILAEAVKEDHKASLKLIVYSIKIALAWEKSYEAELQDAYRDFEKLHDENPNCAEVLYGMAYCKEGTREFSDAMKLFDQYDKIVEKDRSQLDTYVWWHQGYCCIQLNQFKLAKDNFKRFVDSITNNDNSQFVIDGINFLGYTAAQSEDLKDLDLADRSFDRVLDKDNTNFGATIGKKLVLEKRSLNENKKKLIVSTQDYLKDQFTTIPKGLNDVARMYIIQFAIGVFFIMLAIILAALGVNTLVSGISALAGGGISIASLINKAPVDLQRNRVNSAQWMIAYYNWINALYLVNQATENLARDNKEVKWDDMKQLQEYLTQLTLKTIATMKQYVEDSNEPQGQGPTETKTQKGKQEQKKPAASARGPNQTQNASDKNKSGGPSGI